MIYFDQSATTKPHADVLKTFMEVSEKYFGNPSSLHTLGQQAETLLRKAHQQVAVLLGVNEDEIYFTSGGTEGNNLAIKGIASKYRERGNHIITCVTEHPSVLEACKSLEANGFEVTYLPVDCDGRIRMEDLEKALRPTTILVTIMHVNNEVGTIQPVEEIGELLKKYNTTLFHVDCVQSLGKIPLHLKKWGIDLCTFSGHKIHGVKGTGALFIRNGVKVDPLFVGGSQQAKVRSGTENVAGIVAFAKAFRLAVHDLSTKEAHLKMLKDKILEKLNMIDGVVINSPEKTGAPHIINFSIPGIKPEVLIHELGKDEIYVSTRSACSSKKTDVSHVLKAMGKDDKVASSAIRISLSPINTMFEVELFNTRIEPHIMQLMKVMG